MDIYRNTKATKPLLTAGAVALLLAGQAYAQGEGAAQNQVQNQGQDSAQSSPEPRAGESKRDVSQLDIEAWEQEFRSVDENENNAADWDEIKSAYEEQLSEAGIGRDQAFNRFDQNSDGTIDQTEYWLLVTGLESELSGDQQSAQQQSQQQSQQQQPQMAGGSAEQQGSQQSQQQSNQLAAQNLQDKPLVNSQGEELGTIQDVVVNQDSEQQALVVSVGGFLGVGAQEVVLQADQVSVENDQVVWQNGQDKDALKQQPEYNEQNYISAR